MGGGVIMHVVNDRGLEVLPVHPHLCGRTVGTGNTTAVVTCKTMEGHFLDDNCLHSQLWSVPCIIS